jgi:hypothetical protein
VVFVDHAAEDASSAYGCPNVNDDTWVVVGWVLVEALVWTEPVDMTLVLAQHAWCSL